MVRFGDYSTSATCPAASGNLRKWYRKFLIAANNNTFPVLPGASNGARSSGEGTQWNFVLESPAFVATALTANFAATRPV
jgi:hypothetical protein